MIRLADADLLPFEFTQSRRHGVALHATSCRRCCGSGRTRCASATGRSTTASSQAVRDPQKPSVAAGQEGRAAGPELRAAENASTALTDAADRYHKAAEAAQSRLSGSPEIAQSASTRG